MRREKALCFSGCDSRPASRHVPAGRGRSDQWEGTNGPGLPPRGLVLAPCLLFPQDDRQQRGVMIGRSCVFGNDLPVTAPRFRPFRPLPGRHGPHRGLTAPGNHKLATPFGRGARATQSRSLRFLITANVRERRSETGTNGKQGGNGRNIRSDWSASACRDFSKVHPVCQ